MAEAVTKVTAIRVVPLIDQGTPFLVIEVEITCDACGVISFQLPGHHLATLAQHFDAVVTDNPGLCGGVGEITSSETWQGTSTPGKETLN